MKSEMRETTREVFELGKAVSEKLAGNRPEIVMMVLADMVALWLAGHLGPEPDLTEFRKETLAKFVAAVERLIPINERMLFDQHPELAGIKYTH